MKCASSITHWEIITGQDFREKVIIRDPTLPAVNGVYPVKDLTGWTAKMDIRAEAKKTADLLVALESGQGITIGSPNATDGTVEIFIDNTVTKDAPFPEYDKKKVYFDLFLIPAVGDNIRALYGSIQVTEAVTDV